MARERAIAIFIGSIMILSAAGFALNSAINQGQDQNPGYNIPTIVTRQLTPEESIYVLQSGKVLIEFLYSENCTECQEKIANLEGFAQRMSEFAVLEEVKGNETSIQMIGIGGKIVDMTNQTLSDQNLMGTFCEIAIAQPAECLMGE